MGLTQGMVLRHKFTFGLHLVWMKLMYENEFKLCLTNTFVGRKWNEDFNTL